MLTLEFRTVRERTQFATNDLTGTLTTDLAFKHILKYKELLDFEFLHLETITFIVFPISFSILSQK